jgi:hypothetical protein
MKKITDLMLKLNEIDFKSQEDNDSLCACIPRTVLNELWNDYKFNISGDKSFADD